MLRWNTLSIRKKMTSFNFLMVCIATMAVASVAIWMMNSAGKKNLLSKGNTFATLLCESAKAAVDFEDANLINQQFEQLMGSDQDIHFAAAVTRDPASQTLRIISQKEAQGTPVMTADSLAQFFQSMHPENKGGINLFSAQDLQGFVIPSGDRAKNAFIVLGLTEAHMHSEIYQSMAAMTLMGLLIMALGLFGANYLAGILILPLEVFQNRMKDISSGGGEG